MPYIIVTGRVNFYEGTYSHVSMNEGDADVSQLVGASWIFIKFDSWYPSFQLPCSLKLRMNADIGELSESVMNKLISILKCLEYNTWPTQIRNSERDTDEYYSKYPVGDAYIVPMPARSILNILAKQGYRVVTMTRTNGASLFTFLYPYQTLFLHSKQPEFYL